MTILPDPLIADHSINVLSLPDHVVAQLGWLGICTIGELIAVLPKAPLFIKPQVRELIELALNEYVAKQSQADPRCRSITDSERLAPFTLPAARAVVSADLSQIASGLYSLPRELENRPIAELGLPSYSFGCLKKAGFQTVGELWMVFRQGFSGSVIPGITRRHAWNQIQEAITQYITAHNADSTSAPRGANAGNRVEPDTKECDAIPSHATDIEAFKVSNAEPNTGLLHEQFPAANSAILSHPIETLGLSVRTYNCLKRAGVNTIGRVLTVLPQGYSAVRNAGVKTWSEIEDAVAEFVDKHGASLDDLQAETIPLRPTSLASHSHVNVSAGTIELPTNIADALRSRDITTIQALSLLPLFQLARIPELSTLTHEDWFSLMPAIKDCDVLERTRPVLKDARPRPSLLSLNLPVRTLNCLARAGVLDLDTLVQWTLAELVHLRNFGAKSIEELLAKMRAALDSGAITLDDPVSHTFQPEVRASPVAEAPCNVLSLPVESPEPKLDEVHTPEVIKLDERFDAWFAHLDERERNVLKWRYGLLDGRELNLEEIGEQLQRTRERVRQIETKALRHLLGPSGQQAVRGLVAELHHAIVTRGGVMSETELGDALAEIAEIGDVNVLGAVRLLLGSSEKYTKIKGMQAWCLPHLSTLIPLVNMESINLLREALAPISAEEIIHRFRQIQFYKEHSDELSDKLVLACIRLNEKIVEQEDGKFGLEAWERHWQDDIVLALRRLGQPMHYTAIADAINASLQDGQQVTARAVHIRLMQHPEIFVWIGRKGTYGLREWGLERAVSYVDALTQVLQGAGHPLTITEILATLIKLRPYYDEASVQLTLGTNSQFRALPGHTFGLAEWREEDFASGDYRVQRLFETSEAVSLRGAKRKVLDAINGVDSFIARIRESGDYV
jgi:RNA polymerase sigma factor (sigma-70 family)